MKVIELLNNVSAEVVSSPSLIAERLGVTRQAVSSMLNSRVDNVSVGTLKKYITAAGLKFDVRKFFA